MPQLPLTAASPPQISRSDLAPPSWQNSMATSCSQLLKPRACRSALCLRAAVSNPAREISRKICEKMLRTLFKSESPSDSLVFANSTYQRLSAFFFPAPLSTAELIWTALWQNSWVRGRWKKPLRGMSSRQCCESCEVRVLVPPIACSRADSISDACGGNDARSART